MAKLELQSIRNFKDGVIQDSIVDEILLPQGAVNEAINVHFDRIGSVQLRPGLTLVGSQISANTVLGLHQFLDEGTGTYSQLLTAVNNNVYYLNSSTWTSILSGQTASKTRFMNFLDYVWLTNGTDTMKTWNGNPASAFGTTNTNSAPAAKFIENFKSRAWAANTTSYPSRLWYSSIPSGGLTTWTGTDTGYIDISPGDGEDITAIKRFARVLLVFKNNYIYPVYSKNETEPDPRILVGTYSQESVVLGKDGIYFHHPTGIYRLRGVGEQPKEISRPVNDFIKNIPTSFYENVSGWSDADHIYHSIGDVTISGITYSNIVLRWTISTETWTIYSYASELRVGNSYDDGTTMYQVVGDTAGKIYKFNQGLSDNTSAIFYSLITKFYNLTGIDSDIKVITKLASIHKNAQSTKLEWQNEKSQNNEWNPIGSLKNQISIFDNQNIKGHKIRFRISGSSTGNPFTWQGLELLDLISQGIIE